MKKAKSLSDTGLIWLPYMIVQTTPEIVGNFSPSKSLASRYSLGRFSPHIDRVKEIIDRNGENDN